MDDWTATKQRNNGVVAGQLTLWLSKVVVHDVGSTYKCTGNDAYYNLMSFIGIFIGRFYFYDLTFCVYLSAYLSVRIRGNQQTNRHPSTTNTGRGLTYLIYAIPVGYSCLIEIVVTCPASAGRVEFRKKLHGWVLCLLLLLLVPRVLN